MSTPRTCGNCLSVLSDDAVVVCPSCGADMPLVDPDQTRRTTVALTRPGSVV